MNNKAEQLWNEIVELERRASCEVKTHFEYREQLIEMILCLFEMDFNFAINKIAYSNLWKAQKLLFSKVQAHYKNIKANSLYKSEQRNIGSIKIAKVNYKNVLRTMLCEWSKILVITEENLNFNSEEFGSENEYLKLLPFSINNLNEFIKKYDIKKFFMYAPFLRFLHLKIGDIMRYLENFDLSEKFYKNSLEFTFGDLKSIAHDKEYALAQIYQITKH